jgi:PAS domain-containing protein
VVTGWGVAEAAPTAEWWVARIHPADVARVRHDLEERTLDATCLHAEAVYRVQRRDGAWIWISDRHRFLRDARGAVMRVVGVAHDVTDRVRAEEALRERETVIAQQLAQLEAIYQHAPVGLCVFDRELRYLRINDRLAEMNGSRWRRTSGARCARSCPTSPTGWRASRGACSRRASRCATWSWAARRSPSRAWRGTGSSSGSRCSTRRRRRRAQRVVEDVTEQRRRAAAARPERGALPRRHRGHRLGTWDVERGHRRPTIDDRVRG